MIYELEGPDKHWTPSTFLQNLALSFQNSFANRITQDISLIGHMKSHQSLFPTFIYISRNQKQ